MTPLDWPAVAEVGEDSSAPADRDRERLRIAELLAVHAPPDWEERFRTDELLDRIVDGEPLQLFVMAADIRESTTLMKEAVRFELFARTMDKFVSAVRRGIGTPGGWFDKFTGDGFLAYWIVPPGPKEESQRRFVEAAGNLAHTAHELIGSSTAGSSRTSDGTRGTFRTEWDSPSGSTRGRASSCRSRGSSRWSVPRWSVLSGW